MNMAFSSPASSPSSVVDPLTLRRVLSLDEVDGLEVGWRPLTAASGNPLSQFAWHRTAMAAFSRDTTPHVVACMRGERLVALAPLVQQRSYGIARFALAGAEQLYEPADLIGSDDAALELVIRSVLASGVPVTLACVPAESRTLHVLEELRGQAVVLIRPQGACPYIALDDSWREPERHLGARRAGDLRRARRKAEQLGTVSTQVVSPTHDELPRLLELCFEVEAGGWKGAARTALAQDEKRAEFYRQYARAAASEGLLRIGLLRIGDHVAAMQLAIQHGGAFWLLKIGYRDEFAACSPGNLLMRETIRYAAAAGLSTYEFLGRADAWTRVWTSTERELRHVRVYPLAITGAAALAVDGAMALWRRAVVR